MIGFTTGEEKIVQEKPNSRTILELYPQYDFDLADNVFSKMSKTIVMYAVVPIFWLTFLLMCFMGVIGRLKLLRTRMPALYTSKNHKKIGIKHVHLCL